MQQITWMNKPLAAAAVIFIMSFGLMRLPAKPVSLSEQSSQPSSAQQAPNAGDQSNDKASVKLAAQIRRALVKDKNLSVRAHNITIIVKNGTVTLRGMVNSTQEKRAIHQIAQKIAASAPINDLLTVKR